MTLAFIFLSVFLAHYASVEAVFDTSVAATADAPTSTNTMVVAITFPWDFVPGTTTTLACAGAIIKNTVILTSAKCARVDAAKIQVFNAAAFTVGTPIVPTSKEIYPQYNESTADNNLAILIVPAITGAAVAKLPTAGADYHWFRAQVVGPGRKTSISPLPTELKMATTVITWNVDCNVKPYDPATISATVDYNKAKPTHICSNDYMSGPNVGDEGAVLMVQTDPSVNTNAYDVVVGIFIGTSQEGNREERGYGVFVRVTKALQWLNSKL